MCRLLLVKSGSQGFGLLGIAIAFGFVVVAVAYSLGYISGAHINPAVTISLVATRRIKAGVGGMYIISQLAGATLAGYLLKILFPEALASVFLGTCVLGSTVTRDTGNRYGSCDNISVSICCIRNCY